MPRRLSWQLQTRLCARACPRRSSPQRAGAWSGSTRRDDLLVSSLRQREHRERSAKRGVVAKGSIATDGAKARGVHVPLGGLQCTAYRCTARSGLPFSCTLRGQQPRRKADARPTADAGQYRHVLFAALLIGRDVSDDAGRGLELVEFLARLGIDRLQVAFKRSIEHHPAGGSECTRPDREQLLVRPDDLAGFAIPGDKVAHVGFAGRWKHRERCPYIGLARRVTHLERLVIHADMVRRYIEQLRIWRIGCRLLVLGAECGRTDTLDVDVLAALLGRILINNLGPAVGRRGLVHVNAGGPVYLGIVLFGDQQFAGDAVERVT